MSWCKECNSIKLHIVNEFFNDKKSLKLFYKKLEKLQDISSYYKFEKLFLGGYKWDESFKFSELDNVPNDKIESIKTIHPFSVGKTLSQFALQCSTLVINIPLNDKIESSIIANKILEVLK